ncbi:MAG: hypothetical protein KF753_22930 [Caldilineaceae bacterium]|nr:hypothetical protein [Caldilineaceae bacterium]
MTTNPIRWNEYHAPATFCATEAEAVLMGASGFDENALQATIDAVHSQAHLRISRYRIGGAI